MPDFIGGDQHDAESIVVEVSDDGKSGKLYIVTNQGLRFVVGASMDVLSELRRQLAALFT
jgi:hypothetical protein